MSQLPGALERLCSYASPSGILHTLPPVTPLPQDVQRCRWLVHRRNVSSLRNLYEPEPIYHLRPVEHFPLVAIPLQIFPLGCAVSAVTFPQETIQETLCAVRVTDDIGITAAVAKIWNS